MMAFIPHTNVSNVTNTDRFRVVSIIHLHCCAKKNTKKLGWKWKICSEDAMRSILEIKQPARKATKSVLTMHHQYIITRQIFIPFIPWEAPQPTLTDDGMGSKLQITGGTDHPWLPQSSLKTLSAARLWRRRPWIQAAVVNSFQSFDIRSCTIRKISTWNNSCRYQYVCGSCGFFFAMILRSRKPGSKILLFILAFLEISTEK